MRIRIVFDLVNKGASVPFHHQHLLSDFLSDLLGEKELDHTDIDHYAFSGLKGQTKVGKEGLHFFSRKITLVFTSSQQEIVDKLLAELFAKDQVTIGNLVLVPEMVEKESDLDLKGNTKFLCISPITLIAPDSNDDDPKRFIDPNTDEFSDLLYEVTMDRLERSGKFTAEQLTSFFKFQIVPDKYYLEKIKRGDKKFSRIYTLYFNGQPLEVRGYTFPFTLYAADEVQNFVYERGLGLCVNKGFGMVDVANANQLKSFDKYEFSTEMKGN